MNLARLPRRRYTSCKTPIEFLPHLTEVLGGPEIYIKRDDLLGLSAGGNKTRKLEFLMADALAKGADTIITCGAVQSNHCRLTLSAAVKEGLKCHLVLEERVPGSYNPNASGNNFLFKLLGVEQISVVPGGSDMIGAMQAVADDLVAQGSKPYIIPGGGSNELGSTGYIACAQEIVEQTFDLGLKLDSIVTASGSGGTHAGLLTGFVGFNSSVPIVGINVSRKKEQQEEHIFQLALRTARFHELESLPRERITCFDDYVGPGYSLATPGMIEAVNLLAKTEGILLDPVYTGKAMAGLIDLVRKEYFKKGEKILFVHTGGSPALYAYTNTLVNME